MSGKTVKIYLKEGTPNSLLIVEIFNWTGKVLVIPRSQLFQLKDRSEVKQTGVYVLVGQDLDEPLKEHVYIGESDNVWERLNKHDNDSSSSKDFWTRTIIVVSKDENITKAHARYLESKLIDLSYRAGRANLTNGTKPPETPLPESDKDDMDYFLEQVQMLLPVLGFSFAQSIPSSESLKDTSRSIMPNSSPLFSLNLSGGGFAQAREVDGEFIVLKDSQAKKDASPSLQQNYVSRRRQLYQEHKLFDSEDKNFLIFSDNVAFPSPSTAASVVMGSSQNGHLVWKIQGSGNKQTYKDWKKTQLDIAISDEAHRFSNFD